MNQTTYNELKQELLARADAIQAAKQPAYTRGTGNVMHNFESAAQAAGITPEQAWVCHAKKQWDAIAALMVQPDVRQAEPAIDRFADLLNYLTLGYAMWMGTESPGFCQGDPDPDPPLAELRQTFSLHR